MRYYFTCIFSCVRSRIASSVLTLLLLPFYWWVYLLVWGFFFLSGLYFVVVRTGTTAAVLTLIVPTSGRQSCTPPTFSAMLGCFNFVLLVSPLFPPTRLFFCRAAHLCWRPSLPALLATTPILLGHLCHGRCRSDNIVRTYNDIG